MYKDIFTIFMSSTMSSTLNLNLRIAKSGSGAPGPKSVSFPALGQVWKKGKGPLSRLVVRT